MVLKIILCNELHIGWFILAHTGDILTNISGSADEESACNAGDLGSTLGWEDLLKKGKATQSSILAWRMAWTTVSHQFMIIWKTIALTIWTFVGKVMSLPFNMLSSFVIVFLARSKHLLIWWLQSSSAVYTKYKISMKMLGAQSCPALCNPMDRSPPSSSVHGIF